MTKMFTTGLALETIEFQTDDFAIRTEAQITKILEVLKTWKKGTRAFAGIPEIKELAEMTKQRLGLKVRLITGGPAAATMPVYLNKNHVLLDEMWRGNFTLPEQQKFLKREEPIKGTVDLKNARVSGAFSEVTNDVYMNFHQLVKLGLTAPMITAAYLHELGHDFSALEYAARLSTTNQVLAKLARSRLAKEELKAEYVYRELKKVTPSASKELAEDIASGKVIPGEKAFKFLNEAISSNMPRARYDETSFEALADSFPARWGYSTQLVAALEILYKYHPERHPSILLEIFEVAVGIAYMALAIWLFLVGSFFTGALLAALVWMLGFFTSDRGADMTYDNVVVRYKRIRQQLIELLKDSELTEAETKDQITKIKELDKIIASIGTTPKLQKLFYNAIIPGARAEAKSIAYQQLMEELSSNDLFLKAAQFRTA